MCYGRSLVDGFVLVFHVVHFFAPVVDLVLAWAIYCLCLYPEVQDKVAAEAKAVLRNGVVTPDNRLKLK